MRNGSTRVGPSTVVLAVALALAVGGGFSAGARAVGPKHFDRTTILVKFAIPEQATETVAQLGDRVIGATATGAVLVRLDDGAKVDDKVAEYSALPGVVYAEPNFLARSDLSPPNDPSYRSEWGLSKIRALQGWSTYPGSYSARSPVRIGVADTGVEATHSDLDDGRVSVVDGADCTSGTCVADPADDDNGHGTHVAGIAAAETNNANGIAGTAYSTSLIPVKVLNSHRTGTYAAVANGIGWAAQHGARVINLSLSGTGYSQTLCDAVTQASLVGSLVVAAAGNDANSAAHYPAACPGAVGVAATDSSDAPASFSDSGYPNVFLSAPGVSIYSTYPKNSYTSLSGTSMSAPFVSGVAALLFAEVPRRTVADVKAVLASTAEKVGQGPYGPDPYGTCGGCTWNAAYGYGRLNAERALAAASPTADFSISAAPPAAGTTMGGSVTYVVEVTGYNGFSGTVDLTAAGVPPGAAATFAPPQVTGSGSSQLTVATSETTPPGSYTITISGVSGTLVHSTTVTMSVSPTTGGDFGIEVSPTARVAKPGTATGYLVSVSPLTGSIGGTVVLTLTGVPVGSTAAFVPSVVPVPGYSTLVVQVGLTTLSGTYTLTITGTSGAISHSVTATLTVK